MREILPDVCKHYDRRAKYCGVMTEAWNAAYAEAEQFRTVESVRQMYADMIAEMAILRLAQSIAGPVATGPAASRMAELRKQIIALIRQFGAAGGGQQYARVAGVKVPLPDEKTLRDAVPPTAASSEDGMVVVDDVLDVPGLEDAKEEAE